MNQKLFRVLWVVSFLIFAPIITQAQEFSFKMFFEDSAGNRDTITIGYDPSGTDGIDPQFGEINIIDVPLNTSLDVRITDEWNNRYISNIPGSFHTKKQIVEQKNCGDVFTVNSIDIFTDNWPVTASWDSTLFADTCLEGSLFTSVMPYGWWDTPGFISLLANTKSVSFIPNEPVYVETYSYINNNNDTIDVFWQTFGDSTLFIVSIKDLYDTPDINIYPNPSDSKITVKAKNDGFIKHIYIRDITGKLYKEHEFNEVIVISDLPSGIYLVQVLSMEGKPVTRKVIVY
ncbi:MAG TPA: hypothetical protein DCP10_03635 [Bacteroidales bacterium]|nr:hypothetical protein [Bacteroidales bacterium]